MLGHGEDDSDTAGGQPGHGGARDNGQYTEYLQPADEADFEDRRAAQGEGVAAEVQIIEALQRSARRRHRAYDLS